MNDNLVGKYAELKNGTIMIIDSVKGRNGVLIGRDICKKDLPTIKTEHNNISRIIDELCKNIDIE